MSDGTHRTAPVKKQRPVTHYIRAWRTHRELTIPGLADRAGVTNSFISQLERGYCAYTQTSLEKIAKALGARPWQLLCGPPDSGFMKLYDNQLLWDVLPEERHHEADALLAEMAEGAVRSALKIWGEKPKT